MKIQNRDFIELRGKVAFLPGGYGDLGRAIALDLAQRGAAVVVAGRSLEKGLALAEEIRAAPRWTRRRRWSRPPSTRRRGSR